MLPALSSWTLKIRPSLIGKNWRTPSTVLSMPPEKILAFLRSLRLQHLLSRCSLKMRVRITRTDHEVPSPPFSGFDRTAQGDSAHLQFEPRLCGVTDGADGDTGHSPQQVADSATECFVHTPRLKADSHACLDQHSARRISLRNNRYRQADQRVTPSRYRRAIDPTGCSSRQDPRSPTRAARWC